MDLYIKIIKKFTKKFGSKVINRQYLHRKTGLKDASVSLFFVNKMLQQKSRLIQISTLICKIGNNAFARLVFCFQNCPDLL